MFKIIDLSIICHTFSLKDNYLYSLVSKFLDMLHVPKWEAKFTLLESALNL